MNKPRSAIAEAVDSLSVEVVSDLIRPWCYIGKRRLERAARLLEPKRLNIRWKRFQLNPDMPTEGMDRREYRTRKFGSWAHSQVLRLRTLCRGSACFWHIIFQDAATTKMKFPTTSLTIKRKR